MQCCFVIVKWYQMLNWCSGVCEPLHRPHFILWVKGLKQDVINRSDWSVREKTKWQREEKKGSPPWNGSRKNKDRMMKSSETMQNWFGQQSGQRKTWPHITFKCLWQKCVRETRKSWQLKPRLWETCRSVCHCATLKSVRSTLVFFNTWPFGWINTFLKNSLVFNIKEEKNETAWGHECPRANRFGTLRFPQRET